MSPPRLVRISPTDVGSRVSIRRVLSSAPPRQGEVLGELLSWHDGVLEIRKRDDTLVSVAEDDLVAGRVVPPAPPRRRPQR